MAYVLHGVMESTFTSHGSLLCLQLSLQGFRKDGFSLYSASVQISQHVADSACNSLFDAALEGNRKGHLIFAVGKPWIH